ncbi:restriction endonuclease subunit S [Parasediminibacterium paludis]|uniref:Restriction endonuclease subunit S n=1 Tax=Parasediminibacterium paludis TaxID=908966 RepID=A0ABV8PW01_9BACT
MSNHTLLPALRFPEFVNEGEWEENQLSVIANITMGSSPSSTSYNENKIGLPLLQGNADIKNRLSSPRIYTTEITKECEIGDILLSVRAPVGTVAKSLHNACIGRGISSLRVKNPNSQEYLYQWLFSYEIHWHNISQGGTFDAVNSDDIRSLSVPKPKPEEQQKIAACLSSLDEVITAHSQKLDLLKSHKKGLLQNLFPQAGEMIPKWRFKEFEKDGAWVERTLIDTADKKVKWSFTGGPFGSNLMASDYTKSGLRIIQLQNIGDGVFNDDNKIYTSIEKADELLSCNIYAGDIIISKMGDPVGRACIIPENLHRCIMASDGIRLVVDETKYSKYFIYLLLNSEGIREVIEKRATGSTRKRIGLDTLREIELIVPKSPKEQQKIASCLSSLDALITAQAEKIEQLKLHKKGLMQGLFPTIKN